MVTANYSWKETNAAPTTAFQKALEASKKQLATIQAPKMATVQAQQTTQPQVKATDFSNTFKSFSDQLSQYQNPFLKQSELPKAYDPTLGQGLGQNWQLGQDALKQQLTSQATGDSTASRLARGNFSKLADEATRQMQEQSTLSGRAGTGQIQGDTMRFFSNTLIPEKQNLEAQLQAQEEQQAATQRQQGLSNLLSMEQTAQQAKQFGSAQEFDLWAQKAGLSEEQANRVFQAATQDIQNRFDRSERLESQEYGLLSDSIKIQADALQNELDRKLQAGMQDKELEAQVKNLRATQAFTEKMTKLQMAQEYGLTMEQIGLDRQKVDLQKKQIDTEIKIALDRLGMDQKILANEEIAQQIELAGMLTSMDDSDETAEYAATMIANALNKYGIQLPEQKEETTTTGGKVYKGVELDSWNPNATDIDTAEKLASSSDWAKISKEKGIIDLKNAGIDELSLDGDRVNITDSNISNKILDGLYKKSGNKVVADTSKRMVININGVPYMAIPTEGTIGGSPNGKDWYNQGESLTLVSLDKSGQRRTLKFNVPNSALNRFAK